MDEDTFLREELYYALLVRAEHKDIMKVKKHLVEHFPYVQLIFQRYSKSPMKIIDAPSGSRSYE